MYAMKSKIVGYYHVIFGYGIRLNETDKQIIEQVADANPSLSDMHIKAPLNNLNKLVNADFITRTSRPFGIFEYTITPKGKEYLEYSPLSRGERIIILLTVVGIVATIITGVLTSHT